MSCCVKSARLARGRRRRRRLGRFGRGGGFCTGLLLEFGVFDSGLYLKSIYLGDFEIEELLSPR
jgi:hypothetical protein